VSLTVIITHPQGVYRGPVTSRQNMGTDQAPNWYVEFTHDSKSAGRTGDPGYWKQALDGGTCTFEEVPLVRDGEGNLTNYGLRQAILASAERQGYGTDSFRYDLSTALIEENRKRNLEAIGQVLDDIGLHQWKPIFIMSPTGVVELWAMLDNTTDSTLTQRTFEVVSLVNIFSVPRAKNEYESGAGEAIMRKFVEQCFTLAAISYEDLLPGEDRVAS
jgi:hypothetical protein